MLRADVDAKLAEQLALARLFVACLEGQMMDRLGDIEAGIVHPDIKLEFGRLIRQCYTFVAMCAPIPLD